MKKPLLLIVGRTASGKDTLAQALCKKGLSQVLSYTTRPRRDGEDDTHIFIQPSQVCQYPNKMAYTKINGYEYFTTKETIDKHDIYIIDPIGVHMLLDNPQFTRPYIILYLNEPADVRKQRFMLRDNSLESEFQARENAETHQFTAFEHDLNTSDKDDGLYHTDIDRPYEFYACETNDIVTCIMTKNWFKVKRRWFSGS